MKQIPVVLHEPGIVRDLRRRTGEHQPAVGVEIHQMGRALGEHGQVVGDDDDTQVAAPISVEISSKAVASAAASMALVGSSSTSRAGSMESARARSTRCF
jgi:hypothetical protein